MLEHPLYVLWQQPIHNNGMYMKATKQYDQVNRREEDMNLDTRRLSITEVGHLDC